MTADRNLDRELGSWFAEQASSVPPETLLERGLERIAATRQRPGWFVGGVPLPRPFPSRAIVPAWLVILLVALAAVAVVATGARLLLAPSLAIVDTSPSPSLAAIESTTPIATPPAVPTPETFAPRPGMFATLTDLRLTSDSVGWVSTQSGLYRTADTGQTWTDVRPAGWSAPAVTLFVNGDAMYSAFATLASQAGPCCGSPAMIAATHDGGVTWVETQLDVGATSGGPVFSFQTPEVGFASFIDLNNPGALRIYGTADGGLTWTGPKDGAVPHMAASADKLYPSIGGFLWQSAGKFDSKPFDNRFFLSADGGATWTQYTFPIDALSPQNAHKYINGIAKEENGRILVTVGTQNGEGIYESGDSTASWLLVQTVPGAFGATLLSPTEWVLFSGTPSELRSTEDRGKHWRTVTSSMSLYYVQGAKSFGSPNTAWATVECRWWPGAACGATPGATLLLVTTDGGATWAQIGK